MRRVAEVRVFMAQLGDQRVADQVPGMLGIAETAAETEFCVDGAEH